MNEVFGRVAFFGKEGLDLRRFSVFFVVVI